MQLVQRCTTGIWARRVCDLQAAPLDFLQADEVLQPATWQVAQAAASVWTQSLFCPMLPYSAVVLVSVEDPEVVADA